MGEIAGREMTMESSDGLHFSARAYFRGRRLYQALVAAPTADVSAEDAGHFLDSSKILPE